MPEEAQLNCNSCKAGRSALHGRSAWLNCPVYPTALPLPLVVWFTKGYIGTGIRPCVSSQSRDACL